MKKKKPQKSTKLDIPGDPYEKLDQIKQIAVDMRLYNMAYRQITSEINKYMMKNVGAKKRIQYKEATLRSWFEIGGSCYAALQFKKKLRQQEREVRFKDIEDQIRDAAGDALVVLRSKVDKGNLEASIEVLYMAGFKPTEKVKHDLPPTTTHIYMPDNGRKRN